MADTQHGSARRSSGQHGNGQGGAGLPDPSALPEPSEPPDPSALPGPGAASGSGPAPDTGAAPEFSTVPGAPRSDDPAALRRLHTDLTAAGFTVDGVTELVGEQAMSAWSRDEAVPARRALEHHGHRAPALATLTSFFLLGDPVPATALDAALPSVSAAGLSALGLSEDAPSGDALLATMDLRPYATDASDEWFVASDLGAFQRPGVLRHDHVLGIGGASTTLVQSTPRRPVERALDLGTGCGIQTFHLLSHAGHVTATDISERALATTRFNLLLNADALGLDAENLDARVSLRCGSLLEPVVGESFDMVVSNPPFVITPRTPGDDAERYTYRDGGLPGDRLVSDLLGSLPDVLNPGGTAHMLANWEVPADPEAGPEETWSRRPASWITPGTGAWFIQRELQDPCEYAETWLRDASQQRDLAHYEAAYRAYLEDFDSRGVAAVGFGMVWLYRPTTEDTAPAPRVFESIPHPLQQPIAPALAAEWDRILRLAADDDVAHKVPDEDTAAHAEGTSDDGGHGRERKTGVAAGRDVVGGPEESWQDRHYTVAQDVTEERHGAPGAEDPALILLREGAGLRRTVILSSEAAGFAGVCDGELSARQILTALGSLLGWEDGPAPQLLREIKALIEHGFLVEV